MPAGKRVDARKVPTRLRQADLTVELALANA